MDIADLIESRGMRLNTVYVMLLRSHSECEVIVVDEWRFQGVRRLRGRWMVDDSAHVRVRGAAAARHLHCVAEVKML